MGLTITQVDAFADRAYAGNPAAVCILPEPRPDGWMQDVAREMNLSETAFLRLQPHGWRLRWFTPTKEVDLCGHATLASAHVLWDEGRLEANEPARFRTASGLLTAQRRDGWIEMNFPAEAPALAEVPVSVAAALGVEPVWLGKNRLDYIVEIGDEEAVRAITPDLGRLSRLPARGVIVTARANGGEYDFVSRYFAPAFGVPEDPVTGSSHCALGPYWAPRLRKRDMVGYQASARGGKVRVTVAGDRVLLSGQAVTVLRGELLA